MRWHFTHWRSVPRLNQAPLTLWYPLHWFKRQKTPEELVLVNEQLRAEIAQKDIGSPNC